MATSWTTTGNDAQTWTTAIGPSSNLGGADSLSSVTHNTFLQDNQKVYFGNDLDFSMSFNSTTSRLEFLDSLGATVLELDSAGIVGGLTSGDIEIDTMKFAEKSTLPALVEGQMLYVSNLYYLGFPS
tara:strand:+ start:65 stop:445 length:381 start_codon:yes stop_codon:yes gene_type:complete